MTIRKIENARQEECDYINYTIYVSLFSNDRTHKVNCYLSFVITNVGAGFACPDTLTDAYADVFRAGRPRPYRFNY